MAEIRKMKLIPLGKRNPMPGVYTTCREMCASGSRTGTPAITTAIAPRPIRPALCRRNAGLLADSEAGLAVNGADRMAAREAASENDEAARAAQSVLTVPVDLADLAAEAARAVSCRL